MSLRLEICIECFESICYVTCSIILQSVVAKIQNLDGCILLQHLGKLQGTISCHSIAIDLNANIQNQTGILEGGGQKIHMWFYLEEAILMTVAGL
jgi:hypothetical protein